jgi:hypothetical protein
MTLNAASGTDFHGEDALTGSAVAASLRSPMRSESLCVLLSKVLHEKCHELSQDADSRRDFQARLAEISLSKQIISELEKALDVTENKLALEWQATTKKRLVWKLWTRRKL